MFSKAAPNTLYYKVNQTNVGDDSFIPSIDDQIKRLFKEPRTTLWTLDSYVLNTRAYSDCLVIIMFYCHFQNNLSHSLFFKGGRSNEQEIWIYVIYAIQKFSVQKVHE